jgi:ankyrin repeat protein
MLRKGTDAKEMMHDGRMLWDAMAHASMETFVWLLEIGASPDARVRSWDDDDYGADIEGLAPLHLAVQESKADHAVALYEFGANLEVTLKIDLEGYEFDGEGDEWDHKKANRLGCTPLLLAVARLNFDMFELLLSMGANVLACPADELYAKGRTALHVAAAVLESDSVWVQLHMMDKMIAAGGDVNAPDGVGCTPLHHAIRAGNLTVVEYLLDHGASTTAQAQAHEWFWEPYYDLGEGGGFTPLFYSLLWDQSEIFELLLTRGAGLMDRDDSGRTVLHLCCCPGVDEKYLEMVVADGRLVVAVEEGEVTNGLVDAVDACGNTALHTAGGCEREGG